MRIIFMGTPDMAVPTLTKIFQAGHQIEAVFTQPDRPVGRHQILTAPPVKQFAEAHGLMVYQPAKIKTDEVKSLFESIAPDIAVVAAYGRILPAWLLEIPRLGCVNVHFSLLPKYRGAAPVNWAIVRGETETGVTTMVMDPGLDTGPILLQQRCDIGQDETAPALAERLAAIGAELLVETLRKLETNGVTPTPQDDTQATLAPMLKREDGALDWQWPASEIRNRIRGFQPWPGAWTTLKGQRLIFWRATALADETASGFKPGTVHLLSKDTLSIACGYQTSLRVEELQLEGKKRMTIRDFLNGTRLEVGGPFGH